MTVSRPIYGFTGEPGHHNRARYLRAARQAYAANYDALRDFFLDSLARAAGGET